MDSQKILITGGRGFIGTNLMRRIRTANSQSQLVVLDNGSMTVPGLVADGAVIYQDGDVRDVAAVRRAAHGCSAKAARKINDGMFFFMGWA